MSKHINNSKLTDEKCLISNKLTLEVRDITSRMSYHFKANPSYFSTGQCQLTKSDRAVKSAGTPVK